MAPCRTFEDFVVGPSNREAYEAARAAADAVSGVRFLRLHGPSGLGATHLLRAIGHAWKVRSPDTLVFYTAAERFVDEYVDSLRTQSHAAFRKKYSDLDCLLIDDMRLAVTNSQSPEIFYLISEALPRTRVLAVADAGRPAQETRMIERLLPRRSERALFAELRRPGYETRLAIVRRKAADRGFAAPDEAAEFLARTLTENIRSLEGGLIRLQAYCELTGRPMTADTAREIFKDSLLPPLKRGIIGTDSV